MRAARTSFVMGKQADSNGMNPNNLILFSSVPSI